MDIVARLGLQGPALDNLPLDCGNETMPGHDEAPKWRDWSQRNTTRDQTRIEAWLARRLAGRRDPAPPRLLHVGVGNSRLAETFCARGALVTGLTITREEWELARSLQIASYDVHLMSKYGAAFGQLAEPFDIVIDNNPTTFGCCRMHVARMFAHYAAVLAPGGALVTDREGLGHVATHGDPAWRFTWADWQRIARGLDLAARDADGFIYTMEKP